MWQFDFSVETFIFDAVGLLYAIKIVARFYKVQYEHMKRGVCGGLCNCVYCKFRGVCFCQELDKLDDTWLSYDKYKKGDVFWDTVYFWLG